MARNGSGVYSLPAGLPANGAVSDAVDDVVQHLQDLETDQNTARPVVAGGTGATTASGARTNLGVAIAQGSDISTSLRLIGYAYISNGSSGSFTVSYEEGFSAITRTNPNPVSYNFTFDTARSSAGYLIMTQPYTGDRTLGVTSLATTGFSLLSREASSGTGADSLFAVMVYERV